MKYIRLFVDKSGDTHFEEVEVAMSPVDFAPPAPPLDASASMPGTQVAFLHAPAGWSDSSHPAPRRLLSLVLRGEIEVRVSDGEVRQFGPGSAMLLEDTSGKGHATRVVGNDDVCAAIVYLAD